MEQSVGTRAPDVHPGERAKEPPQGHAPRSEILPGQCILGMCMPKSSYAQECAHCCHARASLVSHTQGRTHPGTRSGVHAQERALECAALRAQDRTGHALEHTESAPVTHVATFSPLHRNVRFDISITETLREEIRERLRPNGYK